jgi:hypothetical protein
LQQPRWAGGIGIFFAHQPTERSGDPSYSFQALVIEPHLNEMWLFWTQYEHTQVRPEFWRGEGVGGTSLGRLANLPLVLELNLAHGRVAGISIDGRPLTELTEAFDRAPPQSRNAAGQFGLLLNHAGGTAANVSINGEPRLFARPPASELLPTE